MDPALVQGLALALPAILQPGPLQAFLLSRTLSQGTRRTMPAALAPLLTDGPIILLVLFVLAGLPEPLRRALQLLGGVFLLWLAVRAARDARRAGGTVADPDAASRSLRDAVVVNLLNPNPYITWSMVAGPLLVEAWQRAPVAAGLFLLGFYGLFVSGLALTILIFGRLGGFGPRVVRTLGMVSALALASFGIWQLGHVLR